jgi:hypothetical protein
MEKKELKSLAEHNAEYWSYHTALYDNRPQRNGIACPKCESELWDSNPNVTLTSNPPKKNVHCDCGYTGYRIT